MPDLMGPVHALVSLIDELGLSRHLGDRLETHPSHHDEKERDEEKGTEEFRVDRGRDPRDPSDECSEG
jgi:hypothetical protein